MAITDERVAEVEGVLGDVSRWAAARPDVAAVGVVGSWARGEARMGSDLDLVVLTTDRRAYVDDDEWVRELGGLRVIRTHVWGATTERRFVMPSGLEVEVGIASPSWSAVRPVDPGTRRVVTDGISSLYDPTGMLSRLVEACR